MEAINDIVSEMRALGRLDEKSTDRIPRSLQALGLRTYADRIEAAHKREQEDAIAATVVAAAKSASEVYEPRIQSSQVGNAAKMHEALEYLRDASREFCHLILNSKYNEVFDKYKHAEVSKIRDAIANANAALSAPPRNCDIMDWRTAWAKWRTECHPQKPCGYSEVVNGTEQFMDWYMSEAKKEKRAEREAK